MSQRVLTDLPIRDTHGHLSSPPQYSSSQPYWAMRDRQNVMMVCEAVAKESGGCRGRDSSEGGAGGKRTKEWVGGRREGGCYMKGCASVQRRTSSWVVICPQRGRYKKSSKCAHSARAPAAAFPSRSPCSSAHVAFCGVSMSLSGRCASVVGRGRNTVESRAAGLSLMTPSDGRYPVQTPFFHQGVEAGSDSSCPCSKVCWRAVCTKLRFRAASTRSRPTSMRIGSSAVARTTLYRNISFLRGRQMLHHPNRMAELLTYRALTRAQNGGRLSSHER